MQVLIRKPLLHGKIVNMIKADVLSSDGTTLTVSVPRYGTSPEVFKINKTETVPLFGAHGTEIQQSPSPSKRPLTKF